MEYILSEAEYKNLVSKSEFKKKERALEVAREVIIKLSGFPCGEGYCSECPVSGVGEGAIFYEDSKHICKKTRHYPK